MNHGVQPCDINLALSTERLEKIVDELEKGKRTASTRWKLFEEGLELSFLLPQELKKEKR